METTSIRNNSIPERKVNRKEILEKKKAIGELIKAATIQKDPLASFPAFHQFYTNGLSVSLKSGCGDKVSSSLKQDLQKLVKHNMERHYGHEWTTVEKQKRREMASSDTRFIFVYQVSDNDSCVEKGLNLDGGGQVLLGFVNYRFTLEEEVPVLYVYEIQLESSVQGKGLGKFLMQLIELIAYKSCMGAVVLTVQKANAAAMDFYINKLGFNTSSISPSKIGFEKSYEILCKTFNTEAKAILEKE